MAVPDYQSFMLPILRIVSDGQEHAISDLIDRVADEFRLTQEDRDARLPSGTQTTVFNRTHWAVTYLSKAGLIARVGRGRIAIADRGRAALAERPDRVDVKYLNRFPEFVEFRKHTAPSPARSDAGASHPVEPTETPEESLETTYGGLRRSVESDLLDRVLQASPAFFEQLVVDLLVAMGYGGAQSDAARRVGRTGDDGIDGVIDEDRLGLDAVYVQAKRWDPGHRVRRPDLQAFAGSLEGQRAGKGVFITTSRFTDDAREYTQRISKRIVLIDGTALARLMYDHGVGVRSHRTYDVRRVDGAYFEGEL